MANSGRYVVTGGAGFIGSAIVRALLREGARDVVAIDNLLTGRESNLEEVRACIDFQRADIRNYDEIAGIIRGAAVVFHEAAIPSVPRSIADPVPSHDVNINGTFNVLRAAREGGVGRVVYAASSSAYGDTLVLPKVETMTPRPKSPYALQKLVGEHYCQVFTAVWGLEAVALRYFNVYGPRQDYHGAYIAVMMKILDALDRNEQPVIFGDGSQAYDFVHVEDVARANVCALQSDCEFGFLNVGRGIKTSVKELAELLLQLTGKTKLGIRYEPSATSFVKNRVGSTAAAKEKIGYAWSIDLEEGMKSLIDWRQKHQLEVIRRQEAADLHV